MSKNHGLKAYYKATFVNGANSLEKFIDYDFLVKEYNQVRDWSNIAVNLGGLFSPFIHDDERVHFDSLWRSYWTTNSSQEKPDSATLALLNKASEISYDADGLPTKMKHLNLPALEMQYEKLTKSIDSANKQALIKLNKIRTLLDQANLQAGDEALLRDITRKIYKLKNQLSEQTEMPSVWEAISIGKFFNPFNYIKLAKTIVHLTGTFLSEIPKHFFPAVSKNNSPGKNYLANTGLVISAIIKFPFYLASNIISFPAHLEKLPVIHQVSEFIGSYWNKATGFAKGLFTTKQASEKKKCLPKDTFGLSSQARSLRVLIENNAESDPLMRSMDSVELDSEDENESDNQFTNKGNVTFTSGYLLGTGTSGTSTTSNVPIESNTNNSKSFN